MDRRGVGGGHWRRAVGLQPALAPGPTTNWKSLSATRQAWRSTRGFRMQGITRASGCVHSVILTLALQRSSTTGSWTRGAVWRVSPASRLTARSSSASSALTPSCWLPACYSSWRGRRPRNFTVPVLISLLVVATISTLAYLQLHYLQAIPHVPDSSIYLLQGKWFADGILVPPAPPVPQAFDIFGSNLCRSATTTG